MEDDKTLSSHSWRISDLESYNSEDNQVSSEYFLRNLKQYNYALHALHKFGSTGCTTDLTSFEVICHKRES